VVHTEAGYDLIKTILLKFGLTCMAIWFTCVVYTISLWKESLNSDQQFCKYQNKQTPLTCMQVPVHGNW
jgi:hypothetical protein